MAKCLIKNNNNTCYIQVLNPTCDPIHLHTGLILASINEIDSANIVSLDKHDTKSQLSINQSDKTDINNLQKQKLVS